MPQRSILHYPELPSCIGGRISTDHVCGPAWSQRADDFRHDPSPELVEGNENPDLSPAGRNESARVSHVEEKKNVVGAISCSSSRDWFYYHAEDTLEVEADLIVEEGFVVSRGSSSVQMSLVLWSFQHVGGSGETLCA